MSMVKFTAQKGEIELDEYSSETTLRELSDSLEEFRLTADYKTISCKGCGDCCSDNIPVLGFDLMILQEGFGKVLQNGSVEELQDGLKKVLQNGSVKELQDSLGSSDFDQLSSILILPEKPDINFRRKAIKEMSDSTSITVLESTLLFEYNNAEPIILSKQGGGECCFLENRLCSKYSVRPYSCGLYLCNMGKKLSYIEEMIIRQGTWHAYYLLGWIDFKDISHNPFLKADTYENLLLKDFDFNFENALEQLFFYF